MNQEQKHLRVSIVEGMWNGEGNLKLVAALTEWQAMTLYLCTIIGEVGGNSRPTLLREISHIQFPKLQEINLANNQISTIEGISHILMPHLETISFCTPFLTKGEMTWRVWSPSEKCSGCALHVSQSVFISSSSGKFYLRWVITLRVFLPVPRVCSGRWSNVWGWKMAEKSDRSSVFPQIPDGVYGRHR